MPILFLGGLLLLLAAYIVGIFNTLQRLKTQITASIQEIGNQLKRQSSLIPNLEKAAQAYLKHEKDVFKLLTDARKSITKAETSGKMGDVDKALSQLQSVIPQIQVVVESNPELKADKTVTKFMDELTDTSDKLMYARRSLIDLAQSYNEKLVMFPSNLIASMFGFKAEAGLTTPTTGSHISVSDTETKDVKVSL